MGRDAENQAAELAGATQLNALQAEIGALRADIRALSLQSAKFQNNDPGNAASPPA